jgi:hypothetical protein
MPRSLRRRGVCKVASRGAGNRIETEAASIRQSNGDHAVFKAQGRQANCVVLDQQIACAKGTAQSRRFDQRRETDRQVWLMSFGKRQQCRVSPNVGGAGGDFLAGKISAGADLVVVVENFQRGEAIFANRLGNFTPALVALSTAQLVAHSLPDLSGSDVFAALGEILCDPCGQVFNRKSTPGIRRGRGE